MVPFKPFQEGVLSLHLNPCFLPCVSAPAVDHCGRGGRIAGLKDEGQLAPLGIEPIEEGVQLRTSLLSGISFFPPHALQEPMKLFP